MKLRTPHLLLRRFRGESHLSQRRLDDAVARARKEGWAFAYHPHSDEPGRPVPGAREGDLLHGIYERTYSASRVDRLGHAMLGRAMLEALVGMSLVWPNCGKRLGQRGLLLFHAQGKTTYVLGANAELAVENPKKDSAWKQGTRGCLGAAPLQPYAEPRLRKRRWRSSGRCSAC